MKKIFLVLTLVTIMVQAQEIKQVPSISVSGVGKIKVVPDEALITLGVENNGKDAVEVKKRNDEIVDRVLKAIKKHAISDKDFQTQRVSLYRNQDYKTKKYTYYASQTLTIDLKDLKKYDELMMDLLETGINQIQGVQFKSSKIKEFEAQARQEAMRDAKKKAEDYVAVLNQKVGKALTISDNSQTNYPQPPMYRMMKAEAMMDAAAPQRETLAVGEIEILSTVAVVFELQ
ncbi:SIMPL domain-containing protein [Flavobacterium sp.]|uniref:SIMPL domain-containing protein n=1 Tax=Flavobacterium sp. TaxID=239 RepID=UPI00352963A4